MKKRTIIYTPMREDLKKLPLVELCDELVVSTEKLLQAMERKADENVLWQLKAEVKEIQLAIKEKQGKADGVSRRK
jgi:hypothetical protein